MPLRDSLLSLSASPLAFFRELGKYLLRGKGLLLSPVVETAVFARSELIDDKGNLKASPKQLDACQPENLPDIELIPVSMKFLYIRLTLTSVTDRI